MTVIGEDNRGAIQVRQTRRTGWTSRKRAAFLDMLAATCNVGRAAEAAGIDPSNCHQLRRRDPGFAAQWREAIAEGRERLEAEVIRIALGQVMAADQPGEADREPVDPGPADATLALRILQLQGSEDRRRGRDVRRATPAETDAALMRKLDAIEKQRAGRP